MNSYGSSLRTYVARNVVELTLNPPADLSVLTTSPVRQLFSAAGYNTGMKIMPASNLNLRRVGLFSNFGDGLVFGTPGVRPLIEIDTVSYVKPSIGIAGNTSLAAGSNHATGDAGTQYLTDLTNGCYVSIGGTLHYVVTVVGDHDLLLSDYAIANVALTACYLLSSVSTAWYTRFDGVGELNYMYEHEAFSAIALLGTGFTGFFLQAKLLVTDDMIFWTKTIDTGFAALPVYFDIRADFEITAPGIG